MYGLYLREHEQREGGREGERDRLSGLVEEALELE
jgi:hypothetical protein